jgi:TM2 domain-containing membrane protein YozV
MATIIFIFIANKSGNFYKKPYFYLINKIHMIRKSKILVLALALMTTTPLVSDAAFVVKKQEQTTATVAASTVAAASTSSESNVAEKATSSTTSQKALMGGGSKSKILAALLAFFVGSLGIHRFYMGQNTQGIMQLGLTVLGIILIFVGIASAVATSTATGFAAIGTLALVGYLMILASSIWAFIDFVRILMGSLEPDGGFDD